ncbi:hypothetical protein DJ71_05165 [Halorubrum sp. E3]|nr:hypothetical protein DJ71_05165 [Halorubrum sp. E3]
MKVKLESLRWRLLTRRNTAEYQRNGRDSRLPSSDLGSERRRHVASELSKLVRKAFSTLCSGLLFVVVGLQERFPESVSRR